MSIIEKLLPDLNSRLTAQGFYLEMLEALINTWDGESFNIDKGLANDIIDVVEKATGKTWEEIEELKE